MKICALSDMHGIFPKVKPFDLMLLAGDNINLHYQSSVELTKLWYSQNFVEWINSLPFKDENSKVVFIVGNHEVGWQRLKPEARASLVDSIKEKTNDRVVYLENSHYVFENLLIFGTPYCKVFGNWAYMQNSEALKQSYSKMLPNCDILLSHDAPYGTSDLCYGWVNWGRTPYHIGNEELRDAILEKQPKINIHGHLHSANHECEMLGNTQVYCVSLVDEEYLVNYEPLYLDWDGN